MYSSRKMSLNSKTARKKEKKRTALSIMLVSVCLWFMILKTPASVYITFPVQEMSKPYFPFTYNFFMLINYTNHAVNLILYVATSSGFRSEMILFFKNLFCKQNDIGRNEKVDQKNHGNDENRTKTIIFRFTI
ncbi:hypothetical protein BpHYR1_038776 [Brachionus plicatilis]|uniref:G-protein coupled receptors family 1 profile domain-containing protein n=1 Tax=Brachionus plicatilis TaxID=10195 RepID=A0A3M7SZ58_BRAPC|nr:hypothetical protein BpHYR1_038776 [Brachionus plicatilis]